MPRRSLVRLVVTLSMLALVGAACISPGADDSGSQSRRSASPSSSADGLAAAFELSKADQRPIDPSIGFDNINHVIFVVQENRSFDHYFGTFPGADGIPMKHGEPAVCVPDPVLGECVPPYHD